MIQETKFKKELKKEYIKWDRERIKRNQTKLGKGYLKFHMPDEYYEIALEHYDKGVEDIVELIRSLIDYNLDECVLLSVEKRILNKIKKKFMTLVK